MMGSTAIWQRGIVAIGVTWSLGACSLTDSSRGAVPACEEETRAGLVSPSSFEAVWAEYTARPPLTPEDLQQIAAAKDACEPNCTMGDELRRAYIAHMERVGPVLAHRLERGEDLSDSERHDAELWIDTQKGIKENAERAARNLAEDRTAFVLLEYDADNRAGAKLREFAMCRFGPIGTDGRFARADIVQAGPIDSATGRAAKERSQDQ